MTFTLVGKSMAVDGGAGVATVGMLRGSAQFVTICLLISSNKSARERCSSEFVNVARCCWRGVVAKCDVSACALLRAAEWVSGTAGEGAGRFGN